MWTVAYFLVKAQLANSIYLDEVVHAEWTRAGETVRFFARRHCQYNDPRHI